VAASCESEARIGGELAVAVLVVEVALALCSGI
jgi:hypothetical protein